MINIAQMKNDVFITLFNEYGRNGNGISNLLLENRKIMEFKYNKPFSEIPEYYFTVDEYINCYMDPGYTELNGAVSYPKNECTQDWIEIITDALLSNKDVPYDVEVNYKKVINDDKHV